MVIAISRSQVGRTDGRKDGRSVFPCPTQTSFAEDKNCLFAKHLSSITLLESYICRTNSVRLNGDFRTTIYSFIIPVKLGDY